jgi:DNA-binding MarR family transcriptional regulator
VSEDVIDALVAPSNQQHPDLGVSSHEVIQLITRVHILEAADFARVCGQHGLTFGEWQLLAILRRADPPHRMKPTQLYVQLELTSGGVTNLLYRLEKAGLVERLDDPADRRGTLVSLTAKGIRVCDETHRDLLLREDELLGGLSETPRRELVGLLQTLLLSPAFHELDRIHEQRFRPATRRPR